VTARPCRAHAARLAGLAAAVELRRAELGDRYRGNEPDAPCRDCRAETLSSESDANEYYMVDDRVWEAAGMEDHDGGGYLCIGCLETRLGRRLHRADFTGCDLNSLDAGLRRFAWWWRTGRLVDRLLAPSPEDGIQLTLFDLEDT
jgi:hypothetical protein